MTIQAWKKSRTAASHLQSQTTRSPPSKQMKQTTSSSSSSFFLAAACLASAAVRAGEGAATMTTRAPGRPPEFNSDEGRKP